ncbi:class II fructose-bisphosphate aldolase [Aliifodinibius sp. S!AR15-10]|uniref:class II fructose-bisphosphate aldolase n=1 Tax=Aliifodinibius sp. S!AR15-10 TaxID=2950437 RepID=UPI00285D7006|nr:class II fructose-bisphosphate aldolase [Aliifodinibius sp. S!AR15-10]MDR8391561.1 class II fructose-bisphosphate aldolase [Aliifodinibius sp. S!AR15-10]
MKLQDKYEQLDQANKALLAVNFYNFETLSAVLKAAANRQVPIILQSTKRTIEYLGLEVTAKLARAATSQYGVEAWLHLDHAQDPDLIQRALDAGYDSVMIDASEEPIEQNREITRKVVEMAKPYGASVEAELGYIAKLGQSKDEVAFTQPDEASQFVEDTGINALAVAIGSAHGFYDKEPNLDIELLAKIHNTTPAALVLHGGSGIPDTQIQQAIRNGIRKINLATEVKSGFMNTLRDILAQSDGIDLRKEFPPAITYVQELLENKIAVISE